MTGTIIGNQNPLVGTTYTYEIKPFGLSFGLKGDYEWYLYKKQKNGIWKDITNKPKKGEKVTYRFGEIGLGIEFQMKVYETKKGILPGMSATQQLAGSCILIPTSDKVSKIEKVILFNRGAKDVNKASYRDTLIAQAHCIAMFNKEIEFHLWEDDAPGKGHDANINKNNRHTRSYKALVNEKGIAEVKIPLMSDEKILRQVANQFMMKGDRNEGANHEYYVTATYSGKIQGASQVNVDVANPDYKGGPQNQPKPKPQPGTHTPKFPTKQGGAPKQPDPKGNIIEALFIDDTGNELSKVAVGDKVRIRIHSKNMVGKHIQYVVWEYDSTSNDEVYRSGNIKIPADVCDTSGFIITKAIFEKGIDSPIGDPDSDKQNYFIEIISKDLSAESQKFGVNSEGLMQVEKVKSAAGVQKTQDPKPETGKCPNCDKPVTADDLKTIFPSASETNRKIVADTYTKYMKDLGMNTCWNKAHFFAQAKIESGDALSLKEGEGFNYYWESLIGTFGAFKTKEGREKAKLWGRTIRDRRDPKAIDVSKETQIKIANYAYSPPAAKAKELENTEPNDGWNYRGRGLIQVTGKGFYKYCNPYTLKYNNIDVLKNPDAIGQSIDLAVSSGMIFFKWKGINKLTNTTKDVKGKICPLVGLNADKTIGNKKSTNYDEKQKAFTDITSVVFKIDSCKFGKGAEPKKEKGKYATYDSKYIADDTTIYIDVIVPSDRKKEGLLVFFDNTGILHKCYVLGLGTGGEDRYTNGGYGNVPNGLWKTKQELNVPNVNGQPYPNSGVSFGNHGTIRLSPKAGDALNASSRSGILLHCGHTIGDGKTGLTDNGALMVTHGCLRVYNKDMPIIQKIYTEQAKKGKTIYIYVEETTDLKAMFTNYGTVPDPKDTVIRKNKKYDPQ
ncbi:hypothetical protein [Chryseobacterium sp. JV558]|uniref:hypothetical protein n=1 Tax=Chryseobacterium sp. JV558 TaxID=2663236 RepID=UPI00299D1412|nr:hypothetical protein [Chryseobacterium sp. JV558]MDW9381889.1 hypothetical protein [Chryseobacterium sp. JV558]